LPPAGPPGGLPAAPGLQQVVGEGAQQVSLNLTMSGWRAPRTGPKVDPGPVNGGLVGPAVPVEHGVPPFLYGLDMSPGPLGA
jgi:hypothetical protein